MTVLKVSKLICLNLSLINLAIKSLILTLIPNLLRMQANLSNIVSVCEYDRQVFVNQKLDRKSDKETSSYRSITKFLTLEIVITYTKLIIF